MARPSSASSPASSLQHDDSSVQRVGLTADLKVSESTPRVNLQKPQAEPVHFEEPPTAQANQDSVFADTIAPSDPQGVMQMLSLVGSHFLEADRLGLTGVDGEGDTDIDIEDEAREPGEGEEPLNNRSLSRAGDMMDVHLDKGVKEDREYVQQDDAPTIVKGKAIPISSDRRIRALAEMIDDQATPTGCATPVTASLANMPFRNLPFSAHRQQFPETEQQTYETCGTNLASQVLRQGSSTADSQETNNTSLQNSIISDTSHGDSHSETESRTENAHQLDESVASLSAALSEEGLESDSLSNSAHQKQLDSHSPTRRDLLSSKLRSIFDLEESEEVISSHSCWIFRSVLLQGYLYLTTSHVCFYAYLPSREDSILKMSWLGKKTQRTHRFSKHWAILKGSALSWYESERDPYFPQGHIDLRHALSCDPSHENVKQFTVGTSPRRFVFNVESEADRDDWVRVLRKALFRSHNEGESVRISIPLEAIVDLDTSSSSSLTSMNPQSHASPSDPNALAQGDMTCLKVVDDQTDDFAVDEYYFLHLSDQVSFLEKLKNGMKEMLIRDGNLSDSNITTVTRVRKSGVLDSTLKSTSSSLNNTQDEAHQVTAGAREVEQRSTKALPAFVAQTQTSTLDSAQREQKLSEALPGDSDEAPIIEEDAISLNPIIQQGSTSGSTPALCETSSRTWDPPTSSPISASTYPPTPSSNAPPASFARLHKDPENTWLMPHWMKDNAGKIWSSSSTLARLPFPPRKVVEAWSGFSYKARPEDDDKSKERTKSAEVNSGVSSGSIPRRFDLDESGHLTFAVVDSEETAPALDKAEMVEKHFRECFAVPQEERLLAHLSASLYRVLPSAGRLFISTDYLCFRSSRLASRTVGRTLVSFREKVELSLSAVSLTTFCLLLDNTLTCQMMIPMRDILSVAKHRAFRFGQHGLVVVIRGHEEIFLEFNSTQRRDLCISLVEAQLEIERKAAAVKLSIPETSVDSSSRPQVEKNTALMLRDLGDRLDSANAGPALSPSRSIDSSFPLEEKIDSKVTDLSSSNSSSASLSFKPKRALHFTALTIGSRGDVQPYIALSKGLMREGHKVRIATHAEFKDWIEGHGIEFKEVGGDPAELMRICVENGTFTVSFLREGVTKFRGWLDDLLLSCWKACQGTDVIIESPSAIAGIHVAEALSIPYFRAFTMLWSRTRAYPHAFAVPGSKAGGNYNYMVFWRASAGQINSWRKKCLGLKPTNIDELGQYKVPFIYNFSPSLVPRPLDWYEWIHVTGFWFLDNPDNSNTKSWSPSPGLLAFIEKARSDGKKLVYIGWGSIVVPDAAAMTRTVIEAVRKSGVRAILSKGWSDRLSSSKDTSNKLPVINMVDAPIQVEEDIFQVNSIPHDWLFPKVDAACHHGGAGTLGASLRAGIPTIVKPYFGDQFFWGSQVESLGVGTCLKKFSVDTLSQALLDSTKNEKQIERAKNIGTMIRKEDGVGEAIKCIYRDLDYATSLIKTDTRLAPTKRLSSTAEGLVSQNTAEFQVSKQQVKRQLDAANKTAKEGGEDEEIEEETEEFSLRADGTELTENEQEMGQDLLSGSGQFSSSDDWSVVSEEERVEAKRAQELS